MLGKTKEILARAKAKPEKETREIEERKIVQEAVYITRKLGEVLERLRIGDLTGLDEVLEDLAKRTAELYEKYGDTALPIKSVVYAVIGVDDPDTARNVYEEAKKALNEGRVPRARTLVNLLRNEIVIETDVIPLAVLKDSINLSRTFLKRGNLNRLLDTINLILASIETIRTLLPRPLLEAYYLAAELEKLKEEDKEIALEVAQYIRQRLELAKILGYITDEKVIKDLEDKIKAVEESAGKPEGKEKAAALKEELAKARGEIKEEE
ncbi:MAG: YfdX family protein [Thermotogae bacterium]|nr:YfdX family protein [Thermotogota bacterium]